MAVSVLLLLESTPWLSRRFSFVLAGKFKDSSEGQSGRQSTWLARGRSA